MSSLSHLDVCLGLEMQAITLGPAARSGGSCKVSHFSVNDGSCNRAT